MKLCIRILFVFFIFSLIFLSKITFAHPGRTASDGCHYCRTNCAKWGEVENARHCHGGGSVPQPLVEKVLSLPTTIPTRISTRVPTRRPTVIIVTRTPTKIPTPKPTSTPILTPTLIPTILPTETLIPTSSPTSTPIPTNSPQVLGTKTTDTEKSSSKGLGTLVIWAWVIFSGYKLIKSIKNKQ